MKQDLAFPVVCSDVSKTQVFETGLTKRELFALYAPMHELVGMYQDRECATLEQCANLAVQYADALIAELQEKAVSE